ncbi:hypothetical protein JM946_14185 [Steroidobacter sp. S1-65]|uniref:HTH cro/C1-type domain-containing protein n=1 Tax=Steroidobacter gossypii TaxID=2805490 RepID=A0ABS1WY17_9GAMM|nr:hypothetical protein [Steroidobacter gossypii]MBM0105876.1 hypothetical protein [Steroidobacter gossypii]
MARSAESPFVRAVKRAFADALVAEIHRSRVGRKEAAKSGHLSRSYLQLLLAAERHATIGTLISLAEGLGMRPEQLLGKTMENLRRIRASAPPPLDPPP